MVEYGKFEGFFPPCEGLQKSNEGIVDLEVGNELGAIIPYGVGALEF